MRRRSPPMSLCTWCTAVGGGSASQSASTSASRPTTRPRASSSAASAFSACGPPTGTRWPPQRTSTGPRRRNSTHASEALHPDTVGRSIPNRRLIVTLPRGETVGMRELTEEEAAIVALVREFVDRDVKPVVRELEHADTYPEELIERMKQLGVFGLAIPSPWGDAAVSTPCYAAVTEELARGWMSLAGAMGGHTVVAKLLLAYGTDEQKDRWLPRMATGEVRATMALTEPGGGSDLQAMRTTARRDGDAYVVNGAKTGITTARRSQLVALMCKTDPDADPPHRGVSILLVEHGPGFTVSRDLPKLGYKGVESCELAFDGFRV